MRFDTLASPPSEVAAAIEPKYRLALAGKRRRRVCACMWCSRRLNFNHSDALLVQDVDVRVVDATTGELLRELTIDPRRDYQPTKRPPRPHPTHT